MKGRKGLAQESKGHEKPPRPGTEKDAPEGRTGQERASLGEGRSEEEVHDEADFTRNSQRLHAYNVTGVLQSINQKNDLPCGQGRRVGTETTVDQAMRHARMTQKRTGATGGTRLPPATAVS